MVTAIPLSDYQTRYERIGEDTILSVTVSEMKAGVLHCHDIETRVQHWKGDSTTVAKTRNQRETVSDYSCELYYNIDVVRCYL